MITELLSDAFIFSLSDSKWRMFSHSCDESRDQVTYIIRRVSVTSVTSCQYTSSYLTPH
jgi:hypothetical protein